jgi:hypothetical protein
MRIGAALLLIAVGAILRFAVTVSAHGFNVHTVGDILMLVGIVGLLLWLMIWSPYAPRRRRPTVVSVPPGPAEPYEAYEEVEPREARPSPDAYRPAEPRGTRPPAGDDYETLPLDQRDQRHYR